MTMTQNPNLPSQEQLLSSDARWAIHDHQTFTVRIETLTMHSETRVTDTDLASWHPKLADTVRTLILWNIDSFRGASAGGPAVNATLKLLHSEVLHCKASPTGAPLAIARIQEMGDTGLNNQTLWVLGDILVIKQITYADGPVSFVVTVKTDVVRVSRAELDAQYPGWEARYRIGKELGITPDALVQHAFTSNPASATDVVILPEHDCS